MTLHIELVPLLSIACGVAILLRPRLLPYLVAGFLIAAGVIEILGIRLG